MELKVAHEGRTHSAGILAQITADLASSRDLAPLLRRFLEPIVRLAGAQAGAVRALSEGGDAFELVGDLGLPSQVCGSERLVERHCGHCGVAADGPSVVWAADLSACAARGTTGYFGTDCQRMLVVPLQHRERLLGVYNLFFNTAAEPSAEVLALLKSVGELLGLALDNARLESENLRAVVLNERQMLAAEVHDSIAQVLAFAKMRMPLLHESIVSHDEARSLKYCADVRQAVSEAHTSLREILTHFRTPMDPLGLMHALQTAGASFVQRTGVEFELVNEWPDLHLPAAQQSEVFHIVQEALANVAKHAKAQHARVSMRLHPERSADRLDDPPQARAEVLVEDDGAGLRGGTDQTNSSHLGITIMSDRARRLGGTLEVGARPGGGTSIRLSFPAASALSESSP